MHDTDAIADWRACAMADAIRAAQDKRDADETAALETAEWLESHDAPRDCQP